MLKISSNNITFNRNETIKSLTLQNFHPQNIIFKIKVNSVGFLSIEPSKGFIRGNSSVPFIIKAVSGQKFEVKVLFTYGFIGTKNNEFNEQWDRIKENGKFEHSIILVRRVEEYRSNDKIPITEDLLNKDRNNKQEEKREIELDRRQNFTRDRKRPQGKRQYSNSPFKVKRKDSKLPSKQGLKQMGKMIGEKGGRKDSQYYEEYSKEIFLEEQNEEGSPFYSTEEMQELIEELHNSQKMVENQKIKNIKLSQQLSIAQAKLKEITEDKMHIQIHKSIGIVCEDYHTTFTHLVILGLVCFVCGFFLGKVEASIV